MSRIKTRMGLAPALLSVVALIGCEAAGSLAGGGTQSDYLVARQALETGNYDLAIRRYGSLMTRLDPVSASRVQLEYAHALLRGNQFDEAISATEPLIAGRDGAIRASALAVRGTARHESARAQLAQGASVATVSPLLTGAAQDIGQFMASHGAHDESGSMRQRLQMIQADLRN